MDVLPRVKAVSPGRVPLTLNVEWNDGTKSKVDMTGLVYSSRHFRVFAEDAAAFRQVKPDEFCTGIEWANGLDYSARTLKMLADEQKPMPGRFLDVFQRNFNLNTEETAGLLKVTPKTIRNWRAAAELPMTVCIVLRRFERDPTAFAAHYRPIKLKPRGRPKRMSPI